MARIGIVVTQHIKPGQHAALVKHMREHARATLAEEKGCQKFDVLQPLSDTGAPDETRLMLVEVYDDMAAFESHRANPRLPGVRAGSAELVASQELTVCTMD